MQFFSFSSVRDHAREDSYEDKNLITRKAMLPMATTAANCSVCERVVASTAHVKEPDLTSDIRQAISKETPVVTFDHGNQKFPKNFALIDIDQQYWLTISLVRHVLAREKVIVSDERSDLFHVIKVDEMSSNYFQRLVKRTLRAFSESGLRGEWARIWRRETELAIRYEKQIYYPDLGHEAVRQAAVHDAPRPPPDPTKGHLDLYWIPFSALFTLILGTAFVFALEILPPFIICVGHLISFLLLVHYYLKIVKKQILHAPVMIRFHVRQFL